MSGVESGGGKRLIGRSFEEMKLAHQEVMPFAVESPYIGTSIEKVVSGQVSYYRLIIHVNRELLPGEKMEQTSFMGVTARFVADGIGVKKP